MADEQEPTDEQFQNTMSLLAWQIQKRVKDGESPICYALAFSLLRAASEALSGAYAGRERDILEAISLQEDDGELVSIFPFDKQEEARRVGRLVSLELNLVPYGDPAGDLLDTDTHRRAVAGFVLRAIQNRFSVSTYWREILPPDWNSEANQSKGLDAIVLTLIRLKQHTQWPSNAGKVIKAYLRAIGAPESRFKNTDF